MVLEDRQDVFVEGCGEQQGQYHLDHIMRPRMKN
jgi:hypothetical protein